MSFIPQLALSLSCMHLQQAGRSLATLPTLRQISEAPRCWHRGPQLSLQPKALTTPSQQDMSLACLRSVAIAAACTGALPPSAPADSPSALEHSYFIAA